jgi:hypothetical protein
MWSRGAEAGTLLVTARTGFVGSNCSDGDLGRYGVFVAEFTT